MRKTFTVKFDLGESVVLRTSPDKVRIVSGLLIRPRNVTYGLACGEEESFHQAIEIESVSTKIFKVKGFR